MRQDQLSVSIHASLLDQLAQHSTFLYEGSIRASHVSPGKPEVIPINGSEDDWIPTALRESLVDLGHRPPIPVSIHVQIGLALLLFVCMVERHQSMLWKCRLQHF